MNKKGRKFNNRKRTKGRKFYYQDIFKKGIYQKTIRHTIPN